jgi:hypothetical protein
MFPEHQSSVANSLYSGHFAHQWLIWPNSAKWHTTCCVSPGLQSTTYGGLSKMAEPQNSVRWSLTKELVGPTVSPGCFLHHALLTPVPLAPLEPIKYADAT